MTEQQASDPVPALLEDLTHADSETRREAAVAFCRLGPLAHEAIPALSEALEDPHGSVRQAAARALGHIGPTALPALVAALKNEDKYVRRHAIWGLGRLGASARPAVFRIAETLDDPDPRTGTGAAQALAQLGKHAEEAIPALIAGLGHTNRVICRLSARALSTIGPPALQPLFGPLFHHDEFVRDEALCALKWMDKRLGEAGVVALTGVLRNDRDPRRQAIAARALGQLGRRATSAEPALRESKDHADPSVRKAVLSALRRIKS